MRWTNDAVRDLVETLEESYGRPRFTPRFEPVKELVSCILSQHTTDAVSFPAFARLMERCPEWDQVVALGPERLAEEIRRVGLPNQKARSIIGSLNEIKKRNGAYTLEPLRKLPTDEALKWLVSLPGVGQKTAAIVLCFSFGRPVIPVDTHVFRVSWRLGLIDRKIGAAKAHQALLRRAPEGLAYRFHVALIQHGRRTCRAPTPLCDQCTVSVRCRFFKSRRKIRPYKK
ncbi:MAG: endonuclease III [Armatimonadetes bacterium]|nr:endonuclease III [Armatimonadota bacterium]